MDDFTFPTTAAAAAAAADTTTAEQPLRLHLHHHHRRLLHFAASPLWFPPCPVAAAPEPVATAAAVASKDDNVVRAMADKEQEDEEEGGGEEATSDAGRREEGKAEEAREVSRGEVDVDVDGGGGGGGADEEEKMDLLWENFNEELQQALHQRVGSCRRADARAAAGAAGMELSPESSDAESESAAALRGHFGCAPMMLRPSSRAGGYRRTTSWVLLMKIFRRLFVIEKTIASASGRHGRARR